MRLLPAIDIQNGKCVRLLKGDLNSTKVYGDPVNMAKKWESKGASLIHIVDLDGAKEGCPKNLQLIKKIIEEISIPIEIGGGIRDLSTITAYIEAGVSRVILGTVAVKNMAVVAIATAIYGDKIVVGIDALDGIVKTDGWIEGENIKALQLALEVKELGVKRIIYTDISKDGALEGPNILETEKIAKDSGLQVTISGGVTSICDIRNILNNDTSNIDEIILGKALYEGRFTLEEALKVLEEYN